MSASRPCFVVLDGVDGCGKSTQAARLAAALSQRRGRPALHVREPGSTPLGERIREILLSRELEIAAPSEALLFTAARRALLDQRIGPALAEGRDVVCERFHASTFAYQAAAGGVQAEKLLALLHTWAGAPAPDATLILELDVRTAAARRSGRVSPSGHAGPDAKLAGDRIEDRGLAFQESVARGYREYARLDPRAHLVDAVGAEDEVHARVLAKLDEVLRAGAVRG